jgi:predicted nucleic acid-binding protein
MKALIDTNVVLDALMAREPWRQDSERVLLASAEGKLEGYVTASAATDIFYIVRKQAGGSNAKLAMRRLFRIVRVLDVTEADCLAALDLPLSDFEDALQAAAAIRAGLDCVITRDHAGFAGLGIQAVAPGKALAGAWESD